jgi:nicotinamide-nucleotide amidase
MNEKCQQIALKLAKHLCSRELNLVTAESCTGGWLAKTLTDIPGSSGWFERGFVTYSNESKIDMLGVQYQTLENWGAVSEQTVREMSEGALRNSRASIAVSISGVAGPDGGSVDKPVGTVWFSWAGSQQETETLRKRFRGDRNAVRCQAVVTALEGLCHFV